MRINWTQHALAAIVAIAVSTLGIYAFTHSIYSVDRATFLERQAQMYDRQTHAQGIAQLAPILGEGVLQAAFAIVPYALTLQLLRRKQPPGA